MKKYFIVMMLLLFTLNLWSQELPQAFEFNQDQIDVGNLYHYTLSDSKNTHIVHYYLYFPSANQAELLFNTYPSGYNAVQLNQWDMDFSMMNFSRQYNINLLKSKKNSHVQFEAVYDFNEKKIPVKGMAINNGKEVPFNEVISFAHFPFYWFNTDGFDFAVFFRFLKPGFAPFMIGYQAMGRYSEFKVKDQGEESIDGIPCRKIKLEGQGLLAAIFNANGYVWLSKDDPRHYMVQHTFNIRKSWDLSDVVVKLVDIKSATADEWKALQESVVEDQKKQL